jgi:alkaline phosphatase D
MLDSGRAYDGGNPPDVITLGEKTLPNMRKASPPQTLLGAEQKAWFLARLKSSPAAWKIWCQSQGNLFERVDLRNLPSNIANPWPGVDYASAGIAIAERQEICDAVRDARVTGFVTVSGNRHSFWAGFSARALPPEPFQPVGVNFITAAISSTSPAEYYASIPAQKRPLGQLIVAERAGTPEPVGNLLYRHGFRAAAEYAASGDVAAARALSNPALAPHIRFLDLAAHGYALLTATADALTCEFVCIEIPRERALTPDGGPLRYRVVHRVQMWRPGETPRLEQQVIEGNPELSF